MIYFESFLIYKFWELKQGFLKHFKIYLSHRRGLEITTFPDSQVCSAIKNKILWIKVCKKLLQYFQPLIYFSFIIVATLLIGDTEILLNMKIT